MSWKSSSFTSTNRTATGAITASTYPRLSRFHVPRLLPPCPGCAIPPYRGAFPYRDGRIVPLIDTSRFLDKGGVRNSDSRVIITEFNKTRTAFLVSGVTRIHRISWKQVEAPSPLLLKMSRNSITAVVRLEGRVLFVLDVEAIVAAMNPALSIRMDETRSGTRPEHSYHIIHADDSASIRHLVYAELEKEGRFEITQTEDGEKALKLLMQYRKEAGERNVPVTELVQGITAISKCPIWTDSPCVASSRKILFSGDSRRHIFLAHFRVPGPEV